MGAKGALGRPQPPADVVAGPFEIANPRSGAYYCPSLRAGNATTQNQGSGDTRWAPLVVRTPFVIDRIGVHIGTLGVGATTRLGIYQTRASDGRPGALLLDAGTIDASTTGAKEISVYFPIAAGRYWLVAAMQGATAGLRVAGNAIGSTMNGFTSLANAMDAAKVGLLSTGITGALPTFPTVTEGDSVALITVRAR